jgi:paraquat-inducible protein A
MLALSALALYPAAMLLPLLRIEKLGHLREDSLVSGIVTLWGQGYWLVGTVVFLFSVLLPPLKLAALLGLSLRRPGRGGRGHALVYRLVEALGRWGMLDVMLVAILVAMVKLGGLVNIQAGAGLLAFTLLVVTSLLASLMFDPQTLWQESTEPDDDGIPRRL